MKKIFFAIFAVAALASCMQDEIVSFDKGDAIAFNNAFVSNATKALDPSTTTTSLNSFYVYGTTKGDETTATVVNIYPGVEVTKDGTVWNYLSDYTQYWIADNTYNFAAVAGVADKTAVTPDENGMPATIDYTADGETDLLYAEANEIKGKESGNDAVAFTFDHLLSKVKFTFTNESGASSNPGYTYKVTDIQIIGLGKEATCDVTNYTAAVVAGDKVTTAATNVVWSYTSTYTDAAPLEFGHIVAADCKVAGTAALAIGPETNKNVGVSNYECLVVPQNYTAITVKCRIALSYDASATDAIDAAEVDVLNYSKTVAVELLPGNAYNFQLKAKVGEPIKFTVTKVNTWKENGPQDI